MSYPLLDGCQSGRLGTPGERVYRKVPRVRIPPHPPYDLAKDFFMRVPIFQVDAFTKRLFGGNPAAVMPLQSFPDQATLQAIAAENNLAETAFLVPENGDYRLRWFTP